VGLVVGIDSEHDRNFLDSQERDMDSDTGSERQELVTASEVPEVQRVPGV